MNFPLIGEPKGRFSLNNGPEAIAFGLLVLGFWFLGFGFLVLNPKFQILNHLSHFVPPVWDRKWVCK
jgi:hypothetical protein